MFVQLQKEFLGKKPGERIDVDKEHAEKLIELGVASPVTDDLITPAVSKAIEGAFGKFTEALNGVIDSSLKQFANAQTFPKKHAIPAIFGDGGEGDKNHNFADWLLAVRRNDSKYLAEKYDSHMVDGVEGKTAMATTSGAAGGYTVPVEFMPRLLEAAAEAGIARSRATIVPMTSRSIQVPYLDITNAPTAGQTAFYGGLIAQWTEEASTLNETEPTFRQLELIAHELSGYSVMSNTLLQDNAIGLEAVLVKLFGGAIGWFEDYAFIAGDGVGKPLGALSGGAAVEIERQTASQFTIQDAGKMLGSMLPSWNKKTTTWVVHPTVVQQVMQMVSAAAGVGWLDNLRDDLPMQLLGIPVCISEKMQPLNTDKDVALIDWQHYLIGDRQQVEIAYSEHFKFTNNQATWRFVARVDGQPWLRQYVTAADASTKLSPYVWLS
jgi:HK97 family phage major capsid protein